MLRLHVQRAALSGRTSRVPLASKLPSYRSPRRLLERQQAFLAGGLERGILDRQLVEGQLAKRQVGVHIELAQALHRQQPLVAPRVLGGLVRQRRAARAGHGIGFGAGHFGLAHLCRAVGFGGFRRQVAVDVEGVGLEDGAQRLLGEVLDGDAAAEGAVVDFQVEVVERHAGRRGGKAADQFDLAQTAFGHGRECLADAVDELRQIELGNRQAAADLRRLVEVVDLQFTQCAQLVGGDLDAGPFGDVAPALSSSNWPWAEKVTVLPCSGSPATSPDKLHVFEL